MKTAAVLLASIMLGASAQADNTHILKCRVANAQWTSVFILDAVGAGFLRFKKAGSKDSYTCGLKVDYINDGQRAIAPKVVVEFVRGACDPELGPLGQEIFDRFTLTVDLTRKEKPEGRVQWLRREQPDACLIEKFNMFDISLNAKKWIDGTWGRKTASDPKELKASEK